MYLFHAVKNRKGNPLQGFPSFFAAPVALADVLGTGNDILFKIMGGSNDFVLLRIFIGNAVT